MIMLEKLTVVSTTSSVRINRILGGIITAVVRAVCSIQGIKEGIEGST
jgi:hypothetical protein